MIFYFERGPRILRRYPFISWLVVSVVLLVVVMAFWWTVPIARFGRQMVPVGFGIAVIPVAIRFCYDRIVAWHASMPRLFCASPKELDEWHALEWRLATDRRTATKVGVGLLLLAVPSFPTMSAGLSLEQSIAAWTFQGLGTFMAGVALYYVTAFSRAIWCLGRFRVTVEHHQAGVRSVGDLMSVCWMSAAVIWGAFTSTAVKNPFVRAALPACVDAHWPVFWLCVIPGTLIVVSFVVCQLPLHERMLEYKRTELGRIESLLSQLLERMGELTEQEIARVRFLEGRTVTVAKLPEWPFNWTSLASVSLACISFLFPELVGRFVESAHFREAVRALFG